MRRFAARHGLAVQAFRSWFRAQREADLYAEFLEVQLPAPMTPMARTAFDVHVGGLAFVFDETPPPEWFAAVLRGVGRG